MARPDERQPRDRAIIRDPELLKSLLSSTFEINRDLICAWQYGSSLRSDFCEDSSDVDLLLVVRSETSVPELHKIAQVVQSLIPRVEVTLLRKSEVTAGIHPGWSRHYFINVARNGVRLWGPDLLADFLPTTFADAQARLMQLCQRARLVILNPLKAKESWFWLNKYQHWVPLCLMEILDVYGKPFAELRLAHDHFIQLFGIDTDVTYPYTDLATLHTYLESLSFWLQENQSLFAE